MTDLAALQSRIDRAKRRAGEWLTMSDADMVGRVYQDRAERVRVWENSARYWQGEFDRAASRQLAE